MFEIVMLTFLSWFVVGLAFYFIGYWSGIAVGNERRRLDNTRFRTTVWGLTR